MSVKNNFDLTNIEKVLNEIHENSKLNKKSLDLTSILESLENGKLDNLNQQNIYIKSLEKELSVFEKWTDKNLKKSLQDIDNFLISVSFLNRVNQLSKKLRKIYQKNSEGKSNPNRKEFKATCVVCSKNIGKKKQKQDPLFLLENHKHFQEFFQNFKICPDTKFQYKQGKSCDHPQTKITEVKMESTENSSSKSSSAGTSSETSSIVFQNEGSEEKGFSSQSEDSILPKYIEQNYVNEILYPTDLLKNVFGLQNSDLVTVQRFKIDGFCCLICDKNYNYQPQLFKHLKTDMHKKYLKDTITVELLMNYYKNFSSLKENMGFHQGVFRLGTNMKTFACKMCKNMLPAANIIEHISGLKHKKTLMSNQSFYQYFFYTEMLQCVSPNYKENSTEKLQPLILNDTKIPTKPPPTVEGNPPKIHNITPSLIDYPKNIFDSLENRLRCHEKLFKWKKDKLFCVPCKVEFVPLKNVLSYHISTVTHLQYSKDLVEKNRWFYVCDLCVINEKSETRWYQHLNSPAHNQRLLALPSSNFKANTYQEYECKECLLVLFGNGYSVEKHLKQPVGKANKKKKEFKLTSHIEKILSDKKLFEEKINKLMMSADKTLEMHDLNIKCCQAIRDAIKTEFPNCRAFPFGSRVTGIGTLESDLDVFVDTGSMFDGLIYQDAESQTNLVRQVTKLLRRHPDFADINPIPQARTPIIQVFHKVTRIDCDLSFRHGLSVENTEYLRLCIDVQPALKPLILILKFWLHQAYFDRITTYALCMLIIFYMQLNNHVPSVKMIRELDSTPSRIIAGWHTFRYTKPLEELISNLTPCKLSTKDLMIGFFKYFLDFNYDDNVVCPLMGKLIPKSSFIEEKGLNLPTEMQPYVDKVNADNNTERFRHLTPICIQDPFDLSHNLTKACPKEYVQKFTALCNQSYKLLMEMK